MFPRKPKFSDSFGGKFPYPIIHSRREQPRSILAWHVTRSCPTLVGQDQPGLHGRLAWQSLGARETRGAHEALWDSPLALYVSIIAHPPLALLSCLQLSCVPH